MQNRLVAMPDTGYGAEVGILAGLGKGGGGGGGHHGGGHGGGSSIFIGGGWGWPYAYSGWGCDPYFDPFCGPPVAYVPVAVPTVGAGVSIPLTGLGNGDSDPVMTFAGLGLIAVIALAVFGRKK